MRRWSLNRAQTYEAAAVAVVFAIAVTAVVVWLVVRGDHHPAAPTSAEGNHGGPPSSSGQASSSSEASSSPPPTATASSAESSKAASRAAAHASRKASRSASASAKSASAAAHASGGGGGGAGVVAPNPPAPTHPAVTPSPKPTPSTSAVGSPLPPVTPTSCPKATVTVQTAAQLTAALAAAKPGDSIAMAPGTYKGNFVATTSGTADAPIYLCGTADAVLDGGGTSIGYALHLNPASYWKVIGFTLQNAQKGVVADGTTHSTIQGLSVHDIGDEGIHLRKATTFTVVVDNTITRTGLHDKKFGEGIYVGSAVGNWNLYGNSGPDRSDYNVVQGNVISDTGSGIDRHQRGDDGWIGFAQHLRRLWHDGS